MRFDVWVSHSLGRKCRGPRPSPDRGRGVGVRAPGMRFRNHAACRDPSCPHPRPFSRVREKGARVSDSIRPNSGCDIVAAMIIHRYLFAHYRQVAVYFWPILFLELWRIDRWSAGTGRQAFVQVDRYGRAWVPYFEGMARNFAAYDIYERFYAPSDVDELCPQVFEKALTSLSAEASERWGLRTALTNLLTGSFLPWTPACAGVCGNKVHLDPG